MIWRIFNSFNLFYSNGSPQSSPGEKAFKLADDRAELEQYVEGLDEQKLASLIEYVYAPEGNELTYDTDTFLIVEDVIKKRLKVIESQRNVNEVATQTFADNQANTMTSIGESLLNTALKLTDNIKKLHHLLDMLPKKEFMALENEHDKRQTALALKYLFAGADLISCQDLSDCTILAEAIAERNSHL